MFCIILYPKLAILMKNSFGWLIAGFLFFELLMIQSCSKENNSSQYAYDLQPHIENLSSSFIYRYNTGYYTADTGYKLLLNPENKEFEIHLTVQDYKSGWMKLSFFDVDQEIVSTDTLRFNYDSILQIPVSIDSLSLKSQIFTGIIYFSLQPSFK